MNIVENSQLKNNRHSTSVVENGSFVGQNVTLGCFVQVCRDARVGDNSLIEGLTIVSSNVTIGDRVKIGHGVSFVTPTTDAGRTEVADDVIIGAHAIIHHGVAIGSHAFIAPGAIVERTIPSLAIVDGSPARIIGYVGASQQVSPNEVITNSSIQPSLVAGVQIHNMPRVADIRGNLTVGEFDRSIPFAGEALFHGV
jgi:UDP-2-acetamido-3-amino-2,3-dideoxy-glucuronate N-acetyltransferase